MAEPVDHPVYRCLSKDFNSSAISVEGLDLSPIGFGDKVAFVLHNVFTKEECEKLIAEAESAGFTPALVHAGNHAVLAPGYRDSYRVMIDDKQFSSILFQRIKQFLPRQVQPLRRCKNLKEINERLRILRYKPGDKFKAHCDGSYRRPDGSAETFFTLQIYLNEGMTGGETTFLKFGNDKSILLEKNRIPVTPKTGSVLVFQHSIFHEGTEVKKGLKYTIRMDVLYENDED